MSPSRAYYRNIPVECGRSGGGSFFLGCGGKGNVGAPHREASLKKFEAPPEKFTILALLPAITRYNPISHVPLPKREAPLARISRGQMPPLPPSSAAPYYWTVNVVNSNVKLNK